MHGNVSNKYTNSNNNTRVVLCVPFLAFREFHILKYLASTYNS